MYIFSHGAAWQAKVYHRAGAMGEKVVYYRYTMITFVMKSTSPSMGFNAEHENLEGRVCEAAICTCTHLSIFSMQIQL